MRPGNGAAVTVSYSAVLETVLENVCPAAAAAAAASIDDTASRACYSSWLSKDEVRLHTRTGLLRRRGWPVAADDGDVPKCRFLGDSRNSAESFDTPAPRG